MTFNAEDFMTQNLDKPLETEFTLVPPGEYLATVDDFGSDAIEQFDFTYKKGPKQGQPGSMTKLSLPFVIQDDAVAAEMGRDKVVITKALILDVDDNGMISEGKNKNIELGRIRDAVDQNNPKMPWSLASLRGAGPVIVRVIHKEFERNDGTHGKRAEIDRVARVR